DIGVARKVGPDIGEARSKVAEGERGGVGECAGIEPAGDGWVIDASASAEIYRGRHYNQRLTALNAYDTIQVPATHELAALCKWKLIHEAADELMWSVKGRQRFVQTKIVYINSGRRRADIIDRFRPR